jgi:serine/threonine protein phosphatase 1
MPWWNDSGWLSTRSGGRAAVPPGLRVYAIGDVHGRADLLARTFARIDADLASQPARALELLVGDYIDRGPASRQVIDHLIRRRKTRKMVCLKGNHEALLLGFLANPELLEDWQRCGGLETLMSYGIVPAVNADRGAQMRLAAALGRTLPGSHRSFLANLRTSFVCGDFFFVHAGVRPGVPLYQQRELDLLWIREDFLLHERAFGKIIVHGHTPVREPELHANRINIDTGAFATGRLTCLVIEGEDLRFL